MRWLRPCIDTVDACCLLLMAWTNDSCSNKLVSIANEKNLETTTENI